MEYAKQRETFGKPIGKHQLIQSKITDMIVGLEGARLLTYRLAWLKDHGKERAQLEASIAKIYATDVHMRAATEAFQIHGAYGNSAEYNVNRYFRDAKVCQIMDGTNEIHRVIIAEHGMGYRK
jgi:alkylation response protein AidB-like acyl-CoA dehydrogenase